MAPAVTSISTAATMIPNIPNRPFLNCMVYILVLCAFGVQSYEKKSKYTRNSVKNVKYSIFCKENERKCRF